MVDLGRMWPRVMMGVLVLGTATLSGIVGYDWAAPTSCWLPVSTTGQPERTDHASNNSTTQHYNPSAFSREVGDKNRSSGMLASDSGWAADQPQQLRSNGLLAAPTAAHDLVSRQASAAEMVRRSTFDCWFHGVSVV